MTGIPQLPTVMPSDVANMLVGGFNQGMNIRNNRLLGDAMFNQDPSAAENDLSQVAQWDPQQAMLARTQMLQYRNLQQQQQQAQQQARNAQDSYVASAMLDAVNSGDPSRIAGTYAALQPVLRARSMQAPDTYSQDVLPSVYQIAAQAGNSNAQMKTPGWQMEVTYGGDRKQNGVLMFNRFDGRRQWVSNADLVRGGGASQLGGMTGIVAGQQGAGVPAQADNGFITDASGNVIRDGNGNPTTANLSGVPLDGIAKVAQQILANSNVPQTQENYQAVMRQLIARNQAGGQSAPQRTSVPGAAPSPAQGGVPSFTIGKPSESQMDKNRAFVDGWMKDPANAAVAGKMTPAQISEAYATGKIPSAVFDTGSELTVGDPTLTGADYLNSIPDKTLAQFIQSVGNYQNKVNYFRTANGKVLSPQDIRNAVQKAFPDYNEGAYDRTQKARNEWGAGSKPGALTMAVNLFGNHLGTASDLSSQLPDNRGIGIGGYSIPGTAHLENSLELGATSPNTGLRPQYAALKQALANETRNILNGTSSNSKGTLNELLQLESNLEETNTGPERAGGMKSFAEMVAPRIDSVRNMFRKDFNIPNNVNVDGLMRIDPTAIDTISRLSGVDVHEHGDAPTPDIVARVTGNIGAGVQSQGQPQAPQAAASPQGPQMGAQPAIPRAAAPKASGSQGAYTQQAPYKPQNRGDLLQNTKVGDWFVNPSDGRVLQRTR